jgi:hypothetical protein
LLNIFSKRQKALRGEIPDVYVYDKINPNLRVQVVQIIQEVFGKPTYERRNVVAAAYGLIVDTLCKEYGVFSLIQHPSNDPAEHLLSFFLNTDDVERALDVVELAFRYAEASIKDDFDYKQWSQRGMAVEDGIQELNYRFKEHGVGYCYENGRIIRIDSEYAHSEIVKPTLLLLSEGHYKGAMQEYLSAHEHYRHRRNKEAINDCLKAFESTMKTICERKKWKYSPTDTAKRLLVICFENQLVPSYLQSEITSLRSLLESGIPTVRNKTSGHGQGPEPVLAEDEITAFALNTSAAAILLLGSLAR